MDHRQRRRSGIGAVASVIALLLATFGSSATAGAASTFTFTGGGWGHGVGMSQYGACGMAAKGRTAASILTHYYSGTAVTSSAEATDLRVLLTTSPTFTLTMAAATVIPGAGTVPAGASATFSRSGSRVVVRGAVNASLGSSVLVPTNGPMRVSPPNGRFSRGTLRIAINGSGGLRAVIDRLSVTDFLFGLGEVPSSWPSEALKAQAIAGRTIAMVKATRANRSASDYDLNAALDGAYVGHSKEEGSANAPWLGAVTASKGQVVTHNGRLINAVYSSSSGGRTENSEVVWVSALPYLKSVADPEDSGCRNGRFSWTRSFSGAELGAKLGLGTVASTRVSGPVGTSGRLDKATVTFTDTAGNQRGFTGAQLRSRLGLYSTKFRVSPGGPAPDNRPPTGAIIDIRAHNGRNLLVAGRAADPQGAPRVFIASVVNGRNTWRMVQSTNGYFLDVFPASPGRHTTCVAVLDTPTGSPTQIGCRTTVVK